MLKDYSQDVTVTIRPSKASDVESITEIYAFHVLNGLATFETTPPGQAEMAERRADALSKGFPYLVAEMGVGANARVVGYAYANLYRARPAYRHTLEDSIYLLKDMGGRGIGTKLLRALIEACEKLGTRQLVAIIGDSANEGSIKVHANCGFAHTGTLKDVGFKFGRWVDTVMMQLAIGEGGTSLPTQK